MDGISSDNCISSIVSVDRKLKTEREICSEVQLSKLVLVEGKDEVIFFNEFVDRHNIKNLDIRDFKGKTKFEAYSREIISIESFRKVKSLGIIRDADGEIDCNNNNIQNAFNSINNALKRIKNNEGIKNRLKNASLPDTDKIFSCGNPKIGIFIINPMLENLCLQIVKNSKNMDCVEDYFNCLRKNAIKPNNIYKAKVLAFLASKPEDVKNIGRAAQKEYWDFNSECLVDIKEFMKNI